MHRVVAIDAGIPKCDHSQLSPHSLCPHPLRGAHPLKVSESLRLCVLESLVVIFARSRKDENLERYIHVVARSKAEEPRGRAKLDLIAEDRERWARPLHATEARGEAADHKAAITDHLGAGRILDHLGAVRGLLKGEPPRRLTWLGLGSGSRGVGVRARVRVRVTVHRCTKGRVGVFG